MSENIVLFFSAVAIIFAGLLGVVIGWMANENYMFLAKTLSNRMLPSEHPEMFDENGNPIHSELYSVRFEEDDYDEE